jgi:hypothetical protein
MKQDFSKKLIIYFLLMTNTYFAFAQACNLGTDDAPSIAVIACVLGRIISLMMVVAGAIFVAMLAYGTIKMGMANGDPKGYEGAKQTWTYAVIGAGIILGVAGIFSIIGKLFGIPFLDPSAMIGAFEAALNNLFDLAVNGN